MTVTCPANVDATVNFICTTATTVHNNGPLSPADADVTVDLSAPADCTVTPAGTQTTTVTLITSVNQVVNHNWTVNCTDRSDHNYTADAEIDAVLPAEDPNLANNTDGGATSNAVFESADLQMMSVAVDCPANALVNVGFICTVDATVHNNGPLGPVQGTVELGLNLPVDCTKAPSGSQTSPSTAFPVSTDVIVSASWTVTCTNFSNHVFPGNADANVGQLHVKDPTTANDTGNGQDSVAVLAQSDVKVTSLVVTSPPSVAPATNFTVSIDITVHNNGPVSPLDSEGGIGLAVPADCTVSPNVSYQLFNPLSTPVSTNIVVTKSWTVNCASSGAHDLIACGRAAPKTVHVIDPNTANGFQYELFNVDVGGAAPSIPTGVTCSILGDPDEVCDNGIDDDLDGLIDEGPDPDADGLSNCVDTDDDGDGFSDGVEGYVGTNPLAACSLASWDSAWPADFNNDQRVNISDVLTLKPVFNSSLHGPTYVARADLNASGTINITDVLSLKPRFNETCD